MTEHNAVVRPDAIIDITDKLLTYPEVRKGHTVFMDMVTARSSYQIAFGRTTPLTKDMIGPMSANMRMLGIHKLLESIVSDFERNPDDVPYSQMDIGILCCTGLLLEVQVGNNKDSRDALVALTSLVEYSDIIEKAYLQTLKTKRNLEETRWPVSDEHCREIAVTPKTLMELHSQGITTMVHLLIIMEIYKSPHMKVKLKSIMPLLGDNNKSTGSAWRYMDRVCQLHLKRDGTVPMVYRLPCSRGNGPTYGLTREAIAILEGDEHT